MADGEDQQPTRACLPDERLKAPDGLLRGDSRRRPFLQKGTVSLFDLARPLAGERVALRDDNPMWLRRDPESQQQTRPLPLSRGDLLVKCLDRHLADDIVRSSLVGEVDDASLLLEVEDSGGRRLAVDPVSQIFRGYLGPFQDLERILDERYVIARVARNDMSGVRYQAFLKPSVISEPSRHERHGWVPSRI